MEMMVDVPGELEAALKAQADREDVSVHDLMLKAAQEYVQRNNKLNLIDNAMVRIKTDYADALRRLGE